MTIDFCNPQTRHLYVTRISSLIRRMKLPDTGRTGIQVYVILLKPWRAIPVRSPVVLRGYRIFPSGSAVAGVLRYEGDKVISSFSLHGAGSLEAPSKCLHLVGELHYVVDERTDVVYISYDASRCSSMTVALNADGTPVTKQQLLEELKESKQ